VSTDRTQELLIDAAERLFAEHGFDGVTLKQITAEAGQRNASALQYHFGSKVELVRAIVARRMPALNERRNHLLDEVEASGRAGDLRAVVEALVRPLAELCDERDEGQHWIRFLAQAWSNPRSGLGDVVRSDFNTGVVRGGLMAAALMGELPPEVLRQRLTLLPGQVLHSFVDADRLLQANGKARRGVSPFFFHGLLDMIVAELTAPVSAETRKALATRKGAAVRGRSGASS
jgi:AcrR family transcriptional regulator